MIEPGVTSGQKIIELPSVCDSECFAQHLARCLFVPMVITLSGDIGAGKTTFVRALLRALGVSGPIKSPTYSLLETYDIPKQSPQFSEAIICYHFDLYRVVDDSELDFIGFRDYFQANTLCLIEWPERAHLSAKQIDLALSLEHAGAGRTLKIQTNAKTKSILHSCVQNYIKKQ